MEQLKFSKVDNIIKPLTFLIEQQEFTLATKTHTVLKIMEQWENQTAETPWTIFKLIIGEENEKKFLNACNDFEYEYTQQIIAKITQYWMQQVLKIEDESKKKIIPTIK